jgi:serine/threonine protein kinase
MGNGQAMSSLDLEAQAVENASEAEVAREHEQVTKSINLDWHHPTRRLEDHFSIVSNQPIGRGHFADVYLGQATNSGREGLKMEVGQLVAIKCVYRARCSEDNLHKEVDAMLEIATRHHPNVVALYDAFLTEEKLYLVLEYCAGGELFEHLACEGPYSEKAASEMVKQMAHVLHFLHSHNCTHRDLKPENILLSTNGDTPVIKVADFGLATMKKAPFMTSVCGTWAYCAPEVRRRGR